MSIFDTFLTAGPKEDPFSGGAKGEPTPPDDETLESFLAMNETAESTIYPDEVGDPIAPCQEPWLELTLLDGEGKPAAGQSYELSVPGGGGRSGTLDDQGFVRIDGVDVDASECELKVDVEEEDGEVVKYKLQVVPKGTQKPEAEQVEEAPTEEKPQPRIMESQFEREWEDLTVDEDEEEDS